MNVVKDLFRRLTDRRQQRHDAQVSDICQAIVVLAENGAGKNGDLDLNFFVDVIEREGLSEADLRANIAQYQERVRWAKLAPQVDALRQAAQETEQKFIDADVAEGLRRKKAGEHLRELEAAIPRAVGRSGEAIAAHSNLIAAAEVTREEREATEKHSKVNAEISRLKNAVNSGFHSVDHRGFSIDLGGNWASIQSHPGLLAEQTRRKLEKEADSLSVERTHELKSQLAAAERAVGECKKELTQLEKQATEINEKSREFAADKLKPENFRLIRATPSRLEREKRHASSLGFYGE